MATICPIDGCRKKSGLCIHDKLMIAMGALGALMAIAHWGFRLF